MKHLILLIVFLAGISSHSQNSSSVSGKIYNPVSDSVFLRVFVQSENNRWYPKNLDSCKLDKGTFKLNASLDSVTYVQLYDGNEFAYIYLGPGEDLKVTLNTMAFDETIAYTGGGAERNNMMRSVYLAEEYHSLSKWSVINRHRLSEDSDTNMVYKRIHQLDSTLFVFLEYEMKQFPELETVLTNKIENHKKTTQREIGKDRRRVKLDQLIISSKGDHFMEVNGTSIDGNEISLSSFYGKLTVLDFWATWCGPCKYQFPYLHELEKKYEDKVTFVGIGVWCQEEAWREMAKEEGFSNNIFLVKEEAEKLKVAYYLNYIPRYMILDSAGKIINIEAERPNGDLSKQLDAELEK